MKLSARKSMVALGTALSLSLAPIAAPTMAPVAYAASVTESNYRSQFDSVPNDIQEVQSGIALVKKRMESSEFKGSTNDPNFSDAELKIGSAARILEDAQGDYDNFKMDKAHESYTKDNASTLRSILDRISDARTRLNEARTSLNRVFTCDTSGTTQTESDEGSSGNSSDSLSGAVGSSANVVVTKDGKKYCKPKTEVWVDKLSSFAKILGVVLSVITAVAALNTAVTKNNPFAPKTN